MPKYNILNFEEYCENNFVKEFDMLENHKKIMLLLKYKAPVCIIDFVGGLKVYPKLLALKFMYYGIYKDEQIREISQIDQKYVLLLTDEERKDVVDLQGIKDKIVISIAIPSSRNKQT